MCEIIVIYVSSIYLCQLFRIYRITMFASQFSYCSIPISHICAYATQAEGNSERLRSSRRRKERGESPQESPTLNFRGNFLGWTSLE